LIQSIYYFVDLISSHSYKFGTPRAIGQSLHAISVFCGVLAIIAFYYPQVGGREVFVSQTLQSMPPSLSLTLSLSLSLSRSLLRSLLIR
jgi:hypothetical protein